jgi:RNA polymerase-binding transcription factor DksA
MNVEPENEFRSALMSLKSRLGDQNRKDLMEQIEAALKRLQAGTYGYCNGCLKAMPRSELFRRPFRECCSLCEAHPRVRGAIRPHQTFLGPSAPAAA